MAIPTYLWLKDDCGADIKGAVDIQDREGSIEVFSFMHNIRSIENMNHLESVRLR